MTGRRCSKMRDPELRLWSRMGEEWLLGVPVATPHRGRNVGSCNEDARLSPLAKTRREASAKSRGTPYLLLVFSFVACLTAQSQKLPGKIGASAVWQIPQDFMVSSHAACDSSSSDYAKCMITQMAKAGAPPDAVTFTRALYKESHGEFGVMTGFQDEGPVAFAWITYPLRANTNYGLLLLNGKPPIINVEDLKLLDTKTMRQSFQFQDLRRQFPNVDVWPGDRDGKIWPNSQAGPNGGIQFTVGYPLIDGCHACRHAGSAIFNWNFDAQGKFLGTTFQGMIDPSLK